MDKREFQQYVIERGAELFRPMPWRAITEPYWILISELMLQQTQVDRMRPKFDAFMAKFPNVARLAAADQSEVIAAWQGLGYNRRAVYVWRAAQMIMSDYAGSIPDSRAELLRLPGVGPNTAGAILAYAFNQPAVFIETNIRTVYLYHFFTGQDAVTDEQIVGLLQRTLPTDAPREFFWALMDYGSYLKRTGLRLNSQSKHYKKQAPLKGSLREMRGMIVRHLTRHTSATQHDLAQEFGDDKRIQPALAGLLRDGLVQETEKYIHLTKSK